MTDKFGALAQTTIFGSKGLTISELVKESYETSKSKGWHDKPATFGDRIALCHSELSEALEAYRDCNHATTNPYDPVYSRNGRKTSFPYEYVSQQDSGMLEVGCYTPTDERCVPNKPEGVVSELADVIIRIADMCGLYGIDLEKALLEKMNYNRTRPYRHGGKAL